MKSGLQGIKCMGAALAAALMLASGCVSKSNEPEHKPQLGVAQGGDGWVYMSLNTEKGYMYSIFYQHPVTKTWTPLKGYEKIQGTGETIQFRQYMNADVPIPLFNVEHVRVK